MQTLGAGTFDEVFGPGNTPMWALPTDVVKYQKDQLIQTEQGFNLQNVVSNIRALTPCICQLHCNCYVEKEPIASQLPLTCSCTGVSL